MDWIEKLNEALDYIEANLDGEIDVGLAAKKALCSSFHFQRMFTYIAGQTLGEYIRRRRMTLAAFELGNSDVKVVDLALKYGYDSPTAFTRAFHAIHGVPPKAAREKGNVLSAYPRLTFILSVKGEYAMNYKIEHNKGFRIVGAVTREHMTMEDCMEKVPQFWKRTHEAGLLPKIRALMDGSKPEGVLGVSACDGGEFSGYYIAVATKAPCPEGLEEYDVPEGDWAVFDCVGKMPEAIQNLQRRIMTEWLPTSGYAYAPAPDIEVYLTETNGPQSRAQVWLPIVKK